MSTHASQFPDFGLDAVAFGQLETVEIAHADPATATN